MANDDISSINDVGGLVDFGQWSEIVIDILSPLESLHFQTHFTPQSPVLPSNGRQYPLRFLFIEVANNLCRRAHHQELLTTQISCFRNYTLSLSQDILTVSHYMEDDGRETQNHTESLIDDAVPQECWTELHFTWSSKSYKIEIADSDRIFDLKAAVYDLTNVPNERQKILGLVKGKLPADQFRISELLLLPSKKFILIGTPEGDEIKDPSQLGSLPDVVNDLDVDFTENLAASDRYQHDSRNIRKVQEAIKRLSVNIIHPLRHGKKLLVLDIDYTILDTKPLTSGSLPPAECARPGLHDFLEAIYPYYDICIWSQTSWIWLETKLVELGMVGAHRNYEISFVLDKTCMFTVFTERDNKPWTHSVKALQIIWSHFPRFNATNTIHVDDLSRNFALNPKEGLKISAFKNAHTAEAWADRELYKLARYMVHIADVDDFRTISHKNWKHVVKHLPGPP